MSTNDVFGIMLEEIAIKKEAIQQLGAEAFNRGDMGQVRAIAQNVESLEQLIVETIQLQQHWLIQFPPPGVNESTLSEVNTYTSPANKKTFDENKVRSTGKKEKNNLQRTENYSFGKYSTKLAVSPEDALIILKGVNHSVFREKIDVFWKTDNLGGVRAQSVLWLFCWAKTGNNSLRAAKECQKAMSRVFGKPFEWFDQRILHPYAREGRKSHKILRMNLP